MMRLSLLPPLVVLCSDLLLQKPASLAFPVPQHNSHVEQAAVQQAVSRRASKEIFHPSTGSCVLRKSLRDPLQLGPCVQSDAWSYTPQRFLTVKGTYLCLQAAGEGRPAKLGIICTEADSSWELAPGAKPRLETKLPSGGSLCLDVGVDGTVVTNPCGGGLGGGDTQWFDVVPKGEQQTACAGDGCPF
uniref:Apocytochrome f n=1 Tax=Anthurium amnicola TaxID=1678845 RepID=A0A1D1YMJ6_9ARAE